MKIDINAHILPQKVQDILYQHLGRKIAMLESNPVLTNVEHRLHIMGKYEGLVQVLTPTGLPLEAVASPEKAAEMARVYNDEMAELVHKYPDRFIAAVAILPMNNMDAALKEADRAINELKFRGVLIYTPQYVFDPSRTKWPPWVDSKPIDNPEFIPLYEKMANYNLPIWIHPMREFSTPDYTTEDRSKYYVWQVFSWPFETTVAMTRLVFSGILERYPNLKVITHHCGAMVPYLERRIRVSYDYAEMRHGRNYKQGLTKRPVDYFRMFYNDTAVSGSTAALMCAHAFCGAEHLLFGTDMPYDSQIGDVATRETIRSVEEMNITDAEKKMIFEDNAKRLLRLPI